MKNNEKADANMGNREKADKNMRDREKADANAGNREKADANARNNEKADANMGNREKADKNMRDREKTDANVGNREKTDANVSNREKADANVRNREKADENMRNNEIAEKNIMASENADELWDLYTRDREKTGCTHRRGDDLPAGQYRLAVHVCIFNSKNQLLIQQRQPYKKGWPNMWDVSAAGSAVSGDSSSRAAQRELMEELGLEIDLSDARPFFTMNFSGGFDDFYIVEQDVDLAKLCLQKEEVKQVRWADKEDVIKMQAQGIMIPYWFLDRLFDIRDSYDVQGERRHNIRIGTAGFQHLESWMSLVEIVRWNFPGMETDAAMNECCDTTILHMKRGNAVYAADGNMVVGILLFQSAEQAGNGENKIDFLAVHPEYRRQKIAERLVQFMIDRLKPDQDLVVETFREGDEKGKAARAFYQSLGFWPGELGMYQGYPVQTFVLKKFVEKD